MKVQFLKAISLLSCQMMPLLSFAWRAWEFLQNKGKRRFEQEENKSFDTNQRN